MESLSMKLLHHLIVTTLLMVTWPALSEVTSSQMKKEMSAYTKKIDQSFKKICPTQKQTSELIKQIALLNHNLSPNDKADKYCPEMTSDKKMIVGESEIITIDEFNTSLDSFMDTSSETSSLDARDLQIYTLEGQKWAKFKMKVNGENKPGVLFETKVIRFDRVKQSSQKSLVRRPVIKMNVTMGNYHKELELNLMSRKRYYYPLLIGRNFIAGVAVVDVSKKRMHGSGKSLYHISSSAP